TIYNNTITTNGSDAISNTASKFNFIHNNNITTNGTSSDGILPGTNSTVLNNQITIKGASGDGITFNGNANNTLQGNVIIISNGVGNGITVVNGDFTHILHNNITTRGTGDGISFSSGSDYAVINGNIINTSGSGDGMDINGVGTNITNTTITTTGGGIGIILSSSTNGTLRGINIKTNASNAYGIYTGTSAVSSFEIFDSILNASASGLNDFFIDGTLNTTSKGSVWNLTNVTGSSANIDRNFSVGANGTLNVHWYLDAFANYTNSTNATNANISAFNKNNLMQFSVLTGADGRITRQILLEYSQNGTGGSNTTYYSNYTINATSIQKQNLTQSWNMTANRLLTFTFLPEIIAPIVTINSPANNTNIFDNRSVLLNWSIQEDSNNSEVFVWVSNGSNSGNITDFLVYHRTNKVNGTYTYNFSAPVVDSRYGDLIALYHFDNLSSRGENNTLVLDSAGGNNNVTCIGTTCPLFNETGLIAGAFEYDGINDFFNLSNPGNISNGSVMLWTKLRGIPSNTSDGYLVSKVKSGTNNGEFRLIINNTGGIEFQIECLSPTATYLVEGDSALSVEIWYHITTIWDSAGIMQLYVNGIKQTDTAAPNCGMQVFSEDVHIGRNNALGSGLYNGTIDELSIWNRSLSQAEITNLYNLSMGKYYWIVNASDNVGNTHSPGYYEFNITQTVIASQNTVNIFQSTFLNSVTSTTKKIITLITGQLRIVANLVRTLLGIRTQTGNVVLTASESDVGLFIKPNIYFDSRTLANGTQVNQSNVFIEVEFTDNDFSNLNYTLYNDTKIVANINSTYKYSFDLSKYSRVINNSDLSLSADSSGIAYNPVNNTLFVIHNTVGSESIQEIDLNGNLIRSITLTGFHDTEAIAYANTSGGTHRFIVAEEQRANLTAIFINDGTTTFAQSSGIIYNTSLGNLANLGLEGVAYDANRDVFYIVKEKTPKAVYQVNATGSPKAFTLFNADSLLSGQQSTNLSDLSEVYYDNNTDTLFISSHETQVIAQVNLNGTIIGNLSADHMTQLEGITFDTFGDKLYGMGEADFFSTWHTSKNYTSYHNFTGIANGTYFYNVSARDALNNFNTTESRTIILGTLATGNAFTTNLNQLLSLRDVGARFGNSFRISTINNIINGVLSRTRNVVTSLTQALNVAANLVRTLLGIRTSNQSISLSAISSKIASLNKAIVQRINIDNVLSRTYSGIRSQIQLLSLNTVTSRTKSFQINIVQSLNTFSSSAKFSAFNRILTQQLTILSRFSTVFSGLNKIDLFQGFVISPISDKTGFFKKGLVQSIVINPIISNSKLFFISLTQKINIISNFNRAYLFVRNPLATLNINNILDKKGFFFRLIEAILRIITGRVGPEPEPTPTSTSSSSSSGSSGGGGAAVSTTTKGFDIDKNKISILLKQGETKSDYIKITNKENKKIRISISALEIEDLIKISEKDFDLEAGESKDIRIDFIAHEGIPQELSLSPGVYIGKIIVSGNNINKEILIAIEVESKLALFDVKISVPYKFTEIKPGDELLAEVKAFNLGRTGLVDVKAEYTIKDFNNNIILEESETLAIETQTSFVKRFSISSNAEYGDYVIYVKIIYADSVATSSAAFKITQKPFVNLIITAYVFSAIAVISIIALIMFYLIRRMRRLERRLDNRNRRITLQKISHTYR
ncbi:MAG: SdiA-regulated domain-containing protein, partial [Nanoarchaeota archaeon]